MTSISRPVAQIVKPQQVIEGAGVRLKRSIGTHTLDNLDPFLLLDNFGSQNPEDYVAGFPLHPHRGIETVTYMLTGVVNHKDTLGNSGSIGAGDIQWMTAGGGIMHEEMPQERPEGNFGFQLWVNLPARLKMSRPRYQDIRASQIPEITTDTGARVKVIAGTVGGVSGPVTGIAADPVYLDVTVPPYSGFRHEIESGHTAFCYLFEGAAQFGVESTDAREAHAVSLVVLGDGTFIQVATSASEARFLLISGKPLKEPIARYGPFVMNTRGEIEQALRDLREGIFVWSERD